MKGQKNKDVKNKKTVTKKTKLPEKTNVTNLVKSTNVTKPEKRPKETNLDNKTKNIKEEETKEIKPVKKNHQTINVKSKIDNKESKEEVAQKTKTNAAQNAKNNKSDARATSVKTINEQKQQKSKEI